MADIDPRVEDLLELASAEAKRVERSARIVKQLVARAKDAAAAPHHSPKEDTDNGYEAEEERR